jgi:hypothetical protein
MKLRQREKPVLSFQYTLDGLPWQAVLEKHDDGHTTLAVMLELAALPFTAEDACAPWLLKPYKKISSLQRI